MTTPDRICHALLPVVMARMYGSAMARDMVQRCGYNARRHESPHREPRRDRRARHPRVPRAGLSHRRRLLRARPRRAARRLRRSGHADRPRAVARELPAHRPHPRRGEEERRRGDPSRLRLPRRERRLRARVPRRRPALHRPVAGVDRRDGLEDREPLSGCRPRACRSCPASPSR